MDDIVEEKMSDILIEIVNKDRATLSEAGSLRTHLMEGIQEGYVKLVIDLSSCEYVDSTFLGVLVSALKKVSKLGGDVRLVGLKPAVLAMFELTRMFRVFETFSDLQKAIKSYKE